jgi:hypothetical protein
VRGVERDQPRILVGNDARLLDALARLVPAQMSDFLSGQAPGRPRQ